MPRIRHRPSRAGPRLRPRACFLVGAFALSWAVASGPAAPPASAQAAEEHELKAAFLFHFTKFVEWPEDAFPDPDTPFRICVVRDEPVGRFLAELVAGERIKGRALEVTRFGRARDARSCHIVFLGGGEDPRALSRIPGVAEGRVLSVGESAEFLAAGGMLRFRLHRGRIRLQVNDAARERSRLRISSKLLQLCDLVMPLDLERGE